MMTNEQAGLATKLVGLVHAKELLEREIENVRAQLDVAHNGGNARTFIEGPALHIGKSRGARGPWATMTPEERSVEMKRRMAKRKDKVVVKRSSGALKGYWARMTKEERAAEMQRRILVHQGKAPSVRIAADDLERLHPRDPRSPRHAAWLKKMRKISKATWDNMTPEARQARLDSMRAAKRVNGAAA